MTTDSRWLDILKASGWQTTALTAAFGFFLLFIHIGIVPTYEDPLWIYVPTLAFIVCLSLSLASIAQTLVKVFNPIRRFHVWQHKRREQKEVERFIPYMTDMDKKIIGYLLHRKQKMFSAVDDGGYAAPLISKRVIRLAGVAGQTVSLNSVPFHIPDHIWIVLEKNIVHFPSPRDGDRAPWHVHWMAR